MTDSYEVYQGADAPAPARTSAGDHRPWHIAVEYANDGQSKPPTLIEMGKKRHASREEALVAAEQEALTYRPPDPFSPQGRAIYRDGPDGFLVIIQGAMSTFHMSVRVVQHVGDA